MTHFVIPLGIREKMACFEHVAPVLIQNRDIWKLDTLIDCNWVNIEKDKILTLGIFNNYDQSLADKCNFLNLITSMRDSLNIWKYRGLTLASRIQIFKCLGV